jgi:peptide/nickel transport system ATP-binding protein
MAGTGHAHLSGDDVDVALRVRDLVVEFDAGRGRTVHAVSGISFDVRRGETIGLVGESGCGKSTTARAILQIPHPTSGSITLDGVELTSLDEEAMRRVRTRLQMIFQDPISSLNPRRRVGDIVAEGLSIWRPDADRKTLVDDVLRSVGLDPSTVRERHPHEFSGGQCQRICIARALAMDPAILVCDEPVSALDVSIQAQILNLLADLKEQRGLTMIFVAHDLAVVKNISDRIIVMYLGKICEVADADSLYARPAHPYTRVLLASIPGNRHRDGRRSLKLAGELPSPLNPPSGCRFRTRCPFATERCTEEEPQLREIEGGQFVACHHAETAMA